MKTLLTFLALFLTGTATYAHTQDDFNALCVQINRTYGVEACLEADCEQCPIMTIIPDKTAAPPACQTIRFIDHQTCVAAGCCDQPFNF